jgi:hypothetical protein
MLFDIIGGTNAGNGSLMSHLVLLQICASEQWWHILSSTQMTHISSLAFYFPGIQEFAPVDGTDAQINGRAG